VQAAAPARLIDGDLPTEATIAQVLVSKYADHLPLYRQAQICARQGVERDRSTLAGWVGRPAFLLRPIYRRLLDRLSASSKLFADETTAPVLDPGRGRTKTGQLFTYARDDRSWDGPTNRGLRLRPDRKAARPIASPVSLACCRSTAMPAIKCWPNAAMCSLPSAGGMSHLSSRPDYKRRNFDVSGRKSWNAVLTRYDEKKPHM
jgi:Transposase IS66 family